MIRSLKKYASIPTRPRPLTRTQSAYLFRLKTAMIKFSQGLFLFCMGGSVYFLIEIAYRGHSHISMFLCGGIGLCGIYAIHTVLKNNFAIFRWILGALYITILEFWCGVIVNLILNLHVWSYASFPFNMLGQICLPFTIIWFFLCIPADILCRLFHYLFRQQIAAT